MSITADTTTVGTIIRAGSHVLANITKATGAEPVARFIALCREHEAELVRLGAAYEERRSWNFANPGKGRDWPIFRECERFVDKLLKQAGVRDS